MTINLIEIVMELSCCVPSIIRFFAGNRMDALEKLLELDDRHNELLEQLAILDAKISETLNDWVSGTTQQAVPVSERIAFPTSRVKAA